MCGLLEDCVEANGDLNKEYGPTHTVHLHHRTNSIVLVNKQPV